MSSLTGAWKPAAGYFQGLPPFEVAEQEFGENTHIGRGLSLAN